MKAEDLGLDTLPTERVKGSMPAGDPELAAQRALWHAQMPELARLRRLLADLNESLTAVEAEPAIGMMKTARLRAMVRRCEADILVGMP